MKSNGQSHNIVPEEYKPVKAPWDPDFEISPEVQAKLDALKDGGESDGEGEGDERQRDQEEAELKTKRPLSPETAQYLANLISTTLSDKNFKNKLKEKTPVSKIPALEKGLDRFTKEFKKEAEELINRNIHPTTSATARGVPPEIGDSKVERIRIEESLKAFVRSDVVRRVMSGVLCEMKKRGIMEQAQSKSMFSLVNETDLDITELLSHLNEFLPFSQKEMGYDRPVTIRFISDPNNGQEMLGKTAFYNPTIDEVSIYTDDRHPKDMMRSISHELVHHAQNCRGEFDDVTTMGEQPYMQRSEHLSEMERQAYEIGNMTFRTWEDNYKHNQMENKKMKIDEQALRTAVRGAVRKLISEGVEREAGDTSPLTPEEIRAFLAATGREELTRYVQGDPDLHRAPGTKSPYDKSEPVEAPPEGVDVEDPDVVALTADEEEVEVTEENQTNDQWYNNTLSEALAKRWAK